MIDLHNHILPGVDDGAADLAESVAIAEQFLSEGVRAVVATPHLDPLNRRGPQADAVRRLVQAVREALSSAELPLEVLPGHEVFLTPEVPRLLADGIAQSLAGGRFVLVELSLTAGERPPYLEDVLFQLQVGGYQPILAHPERYAFVQRDPTALESVVDRGVALQLTAPSLFGHYGPRVRKTAERLLRQGQYRLGASDRHHADQPRSLRDLHRATTRLTTSAVADLLLAGNPERVLRGEELEAPPTFPAHRQWRLPFGRE